MVDQWIQSRIAQYLRDKTNSFIKEGPTELESQQCKYHYCISRSIWYQVRIVHTCVIKLDQNNPLYWVIKNCGILYLERSTLQQLDYIEFNQVIYLLLFDKFSYSNHLTLDGCKKYLSKQKNKILNNINCSQKNLISSFYKKYISSSNKPLQIQQVNSYYPIQKYQKEVIQKYNCPYFEGFVLERQIITHKGVEYEQTHLMICYKKQLNFMNGQICSKKIIVNSLIEKNGKNQSIIKRKLISIGQSNFLELLTKQQYEEIFPNYKHFYKSFTQKRSYRVGIDFQIDDDKLPFKPGSVLRVDRGNYFHAGVFLKQNLVIHVKITKKSQNGQIFNFDTFDQFIQDSKTIEQIRFDIIFFTDIEIMERAIKMNKNTYNYELVSQNCEHLSFELISKLKFSPQVFSFFKKLMASIFHKNQITSIRNLRSLQNEQ